MQSYRSIRKFSYGEYSGNYGVNCVAVEIGSLTLYFSYDTVVAFRDGFDFEVSENCWGTTTGKHLNWINQDKEIRLSRTEFEDKLQKCLEKHKLEV